MDKLLAEIVANDAAGKPSYVSADAKPLVDAGYIEVNLEVKNPANPSQVLCRSTDAGKAKVASGTTQEAPKPAGSHAMLVTGAVLPPAKKRGNTAGSGAPTKYPFADLEVGGMFFSPNSDHAKGDAVKALGSTVSAQNDKYAEAIVENGVVKTKTVTRAVRDKQTKKAVLNADGSKQTETVELPVKKYNRKFTIRPVEGGKNYGSWTAPADGALVARIL